MSTGRRQELLRALPFALYGLFFWRSAYSLGSPLLRLLDWLVPVGALGIWAAWRWRRKEPWPRTSVDRPLLLLGLVTAVTMVFSTNTRNSLHATWELWLGLLVLWALVDAVRRGWAGALWRVLYLMGGVVCLVSAVEFLAWYFGWPLLPSFQQGWPTIGGLADPLPPTLHRLGLASGSTTALSAFLALLIPPAITLSVGSRQREVRVGMILWVVGASVIELLTLSRGGFLALGVSLPLLLVGSTAAPWFQRERSRSQSKAWRWLLVGAIFVTLGAMLGTGFWAAVRFASHTSGDEIRVDLWRSALAMFLDQPLAGVGPAAYGMALRVYRNPLLVPDYMRTAHNLYLHAGAETGVWGLLAGAWLLLLLGRAWWQRWRAETAGSASWWRVLGTGAALAGLAAQSAVDTFCEPLILLAAAFFLALILAPQPPQALVVSRQRRWPWTATAAILLLGAVGFGWDDYGYALFAKSMAWTQRGDMDTALSLAKRARAYDPGLGLYTCHTGYLYGRQGSTAVALERYDECLAESLAPGWVEQLNQAALLWEDGQQAEALIAVRGATARTPLEWMPWLNQGLWAEATDEPGEAVEAYGWVLALDPELAGSPFWQTGQRADEWKAILEAGRKAAARLGKTTTSWRWQVLVAAESSQEAAAELGVWLDDHPDDVEAMAWMGEVLLRLGQPADALGWLDRVVSARPDRARTYLVRGQAKLALKQYEEAERDLRTNLFLQPGTRVHLELARLAQQRGDEQVALQEYSRALRPLVMTQGYNVVLYHRFGWPVPLPQLSRIGYQQDAETALEWGALLEQRGEAAMAQQVYATALALDPYLDSVRQRLETGAHDR